MFLFEESRSDVCYPCVSGNLRTLPDFVSLDPLNPSTPTGFTCPSATSQGQSVAAVPGQLSSKERKAGEAVSLWDSPSVQTATTIATEPTPLKSPPVSCVQSASCQGSSCPLCRHDCGDQAGLRVHLLQQHRVAPDGVPRLIRMVDMPSAAAGATSSIDADASEGNDGAGRVLLPSSPSPPDGLTADEVKSLPPGTSDSDQVWTVTKAVPSANVPANTCQENGKDSHIPRGDCDISPSRELNANNLCAKSPPNKEDSPWSSTATPGNHTNFIRSSNGEAALPNGVTSPSPPAGSAPRGTDARPSPSPNLVPSFPSASAAPPTVTSNTLSGVLSTVTAPARTEGPQHKSWPASLVQGQSRNKEGDSGSNSNSSKNFLSREINLDLLQSEHERLLTEEGEKDQHFQHFLNSSICLKYYLVQF